MMKFWLADNIIRVFLLAVAICGLNSCDVPRQKKPAIEKISAEPIAEKTIHDLIVEGDTTGFIDWLFTTDDLNVRENSRLSTPLISAVLAARPGYVRDLIEKGAQPDLTDIDGQTALHQAARINHVEILQMLLNAGANPVITDRQGFTALDEATSQEHSNAIKLLTEARNAYLASQAERTNHVEAAKTGQFTAAELLSTDFRIWTSASGERLDAAFIQNVFDSVILQNREGILVRIGINRLIPDDQILVRKLSGIDPHSLAGARGTTVKIKRQFDSLALRIGKDSDWKALEGCRLLRNSSNDGDSFHVEHEGKEYIFRLYFVDAAETNDDFPERVKEQADYFRMNNNAALKLGNEAAKFTTSLLASTAFTVVTKWDDARGSSSLPRYYAMVITPLGDLDELLTREGLVRQYGMNVDGSLGSKKTSLLRKLEQEAKDQHAGAWSKSDDQANRH